MTFIRASGPGGQNVNKVATAAQLRFDVLASPSLAAETKARLAVLAGARITRAGVIVLTARRFRTQERNRQDALDRLAALIRAAAEPIVPRRPTKPSRAARRRRTDDKTHRGALKRQRSTRADD